MKEYTKRDGERVEGKQCWNVWWQVVVESSGERIKFKESGYYGQLTMNKGREAEERLI